MLGAGLLSVSLCGSHSSTAAPFCRTTGNSTEPHVFSRQRCPRLSPPSKGSMYLQEAKHGSNEQYWKSLQLWEALLCAGATALGGATKERQGPVTLCPAHSTVGPSVQNRRQTSQKSQSVWAEEQE